MYEVPAKAKNRDPENPITCWQKDTLYRLLLTRTENKAEDQWTLVYTLD